MMECFYEVHYDFDRVEIFDFLGEARNRAKELISEDADDVYIIKVEEVDVENVGK